MVLLRINVIYYSFFNLNKTESKIWNSNWYLLINSARDIFPKLIMPKDMQYEKNEVLPVIRQLIIEKKQNNNYSLKTN